MAARPLRFTSDGSDVVVDNIQFNLSILQAVELPSASDQDLIKGLENEIKYDINLQTNWNEAVKWFATVPKVGDWARNEKYHLALRTYSLNMFYVDFNQACRNIPSVEAAKSFTFRNYFNLLLRAIRNVKGEPPVIARSTNLYRGCTIKFPHLKVNGKFLFKQFSSASLVKESTQQFLGTNGTLFIVEGINHGVIGLRNHSAFPNESEVLINPFQLFEVVKIDGGGNSHTMVTLKAL